MGHVLHAVIGANRTLDALKSWHQLRIIPLPQDFGLIPLTTALHDDIVELANAREPDPYPGFERLSAGVELVLRESSRTGPLAYIETDYFGGVGTQRAIAWQDREVLIGPFATETSWNDAGLIAEPKEAGAINQVLAVLGVWTRGNFDHFDMLGLSHFRSTESATRKSARPPQ
jgi:hypothetical protein